MPLDLHAGVNPRHLGHLISPTHFKDRLYSTIFICQFRVVRGIEIHFAKSPKIKNMESYSIQSEANILYPMNPLLLSAGSGYLRGRESGYRPFNWVNFSFDFNRIVSEVDNGIGLTSWRLTL